MEYSGQVQEMLKNNKVLIQQAWRSTVSNIYKLRQKYLNFAIPKCFTNNTVRGPHGKDCPGMLSGPQQLGQDDCHSRLQCTAARVVDTRAWKSSIRRFVITEKAPTRAFSWLKAATTAFTFKTLLRYYTKRALTPRSLNVKLGPRHNYHGRL